MQLHVHNKQLWLLLMRESFVKERKTKTHNGIFFHSLKKQLCIEIYIETWFNVFTVIIELRLRWPLIIELISKSLVRDLPKIGWLWNSKKKILQNYTNLKFCRIRSSKLISINKSNQRMQYENKFSLEWLMVVEKLTGKHKESWNNQYLQNTNPEI